MNLLSSEPIILRTHEAKKKSSETTVYTKTDVKTDNRWYQLYPLPADKCEQLQRSKDEFRPKTQSIPLTSDSNLHLLGQEKAYVNYKLLF